MQGMISVENRPGTGVCFSLSLPFSIASSLCLLIEVGDQVVALPARQVTRLIRLRPGQMWAENGTILLAPDDKGTEPIPVIHLAQVLGFDRPVLLSTPATQAYETAVLIGTSSQPVALLVDKLQEAQEIVIKKLPPPFQHTPYAAGAAILGTGKVILVLNVADLMRFATDHHS
jgi:two-component system chemotaxis sensor kinase CheA